MSSSASQKADETERKPEATRRRRTIKERREIAEASLKAGATVQEVAEAYEVHPTQIRKWRRLYRNGQLGNTATSAMLAVRIAEGVEPEKRSHTWKPQRNEGGAIHIEFARARVSIEGKADAAMVRAVLECLAG
jgi:transposase-like protein